MINKSSSADRPSKADHAPSHNNSSSADRPSKADRAPSLHPSRDGNLTFNTHFWYGPLGKL